MPRAHDINILNMTFFCIAYKYLSSNGIILRLCIPKLIILPICISKKLLMASLLNYSAVIKNDYVLTEAAGR